MIKMSKLSVRLTFDMIALSVTVALKLSDDLNLNEIDCARLLVSANQEWGLLGRDPVEILRLAAGLWYTERRDLITALYTLLRAVVLDQGLEVDLVADIQKYLEDLISSGLRQRLISLIKELNREEPAGLGGPHSERYVLDSRGALVERQAVVCRERLILGHCLVLSILVVRASPKDVKDIFSALKDSSAELNGSNDTLKHQIAYSLLFSLVIAVISDALSTAPDKMSVLSRDASFRREFQETVIASGSDLIAEGFVDCVRLAWATHLMLILDGNDTRENVPSASPSDIGYISSCLETIFSNNVFQFFLVKILQTAAYQNDDEDMTYMYNAYLHKLITCFLSHPHAREKVKETKEKAMTALSPYRIAGSLDYMHDSSAHSQQATETAPQPFVSLLEFVSEIYQKEPELLSGNDVLWTFVNFAGEDHTNFQTLVAFLKMLSTLASSQEGASKVFELLQGKTFRSIGWSTLFDCLSIYEEKFKQSLQSPGAMLPEFQEGDAKTLVAYLNVLQKVVENGNPTETKNWFPEIEPLFKLLSYENVPPYLKGALRNAIATFVRVSPTLKDTIWRYLEQYDLPVVVGPHPGSSTPSMTAQVYDMRFELNEIEARREQYPSTISFLNLLNVLISGERDVSDRGRRFIGIFRFIYDHVFGPFPQRAYADPCEKWQLVIACLQHFRMILSLYDVVDEDVDNIIDQSQPSAVAESASFQMQLPIIELLKVTIFDVKFVQDFMSGKIVFRNVMGILLPGVNSIISERTNQIYGQLLEKAVMLSLEIIILVLEKDLTISDFWRPLYQLLLKSNAASSLVEDYAACLELRSEESQIIENSSEDPGVLILQLLIDNINRPAPNIAHLLLKFDLDTPVERTVLQPKFHYSCLKVMLDILEKLSKPDINALLHEFGFQRAWLLKLLSIELHTADMANSSHREACQSILAHLFGQDVIEYGTDSNIPQSFLLQNSADIVGTGTISKSKVLEMLEVVQFRSPDTSMKYSQAVSNMKYGFLAEDILRNPATSGKGGIYYFSERGDRLFDLAAFRDKLWQKCNAINPQLSSFGSEVELNEVSDTIQQLLRWGWKYNKNLEEQAAQLHMLTGWSQIVEFFCSPFCCFGRLLDASLCASASPDCSLKMAIILTQVALTCMAKLRDERFLCPGSLNADTVTCLDIIMAKQLSNGACNSILFKLIMAILRNESSEALRRRQYALLLSYFQYCRHMLDPDVPMSVLQFLLLDEQNAEDLDLQKIDKEQAELARANFSIVKKDAQAILDLVGATSYVMKDATQGSESGKTISLYVLDALICIDYEKFFLSQLQSRGFLRSCFMSISNLSYQDGGRSLDSLQRVCTLEAELSLLLRICYRYGKSGAQVLFSMGALEHIASCRAVNMQIKGSLRRVDAKFGRDLSVDVDKRRMIIAPILRLVFSLTSLIDASDFFEVKNKIVREVMDFVKRHRFIFDQVLREDVSEADELTTEQLNLVVGILSKVWPFDESGEYGFVQGLFGMMCALFSRDSESLSFNKSVRALENQRKSELNTFGLCVSLSSYLYSLVTKNTVTLQVSDSLTDYRASAGQQQPTLTLLGSFLSSVTTVLERAAEEKSLLLNKIQDINDLSRQEVDDIISMCIRQDHVASSDNIQRRRYIAMVEMCRIAGNRDQLINLLLVLAENVANIILVHFQDGSHLPDPVAAMKTITYSSKPDTGEDMPSLCEKLIPTLERLESLSEDKTGHNLKVICCTIMLSRGWHMLL
ncbi:hypothetical protein C3L33_03696, partial [Rhododendron williamsianum]